MNQLQSSLYINGFELHVHLGLSDEERAQPQTVVLDIQLKFSEPPKACATDQLEDTYCYSTLTQWIAKQLQEKQFHLLEHLAHEIYQLIKNHISDQTQIQLCITKFPPIAGLTGGASFAFGDFN